MAAVSLGEGRDGPFLVVERSSTRCTYIHCWVSGSFSTIRQTTRNVEFPCMLGVLALGLALGIWRKLGEHVVGVKQDKTGEMGRNTCKDGAAMTSLKKETSDI